MIINGKKIAAKEFGFDNCHKIYLINTEKDKKDLIDLGYDLYPISQLQESYNESCSLRFISNADLQGDNVVNQFETAIFES